MCYPKELVYPREGGEIQLEQVKARLPQYTPSFLNDSEGECDMDITMAGGGHITMHVPCVPDLFKPGAMQLVQSSSSSNKNTYGSAAKTRYIYVHVGSVVLIGKKSVCYHLIANFASN